MNRTRKAALAVGILAAVFVCGYLSKPDRGGISRCAKIFEISELKEYGLVHKSFLTWESFESPKFRFEISEDGFDQLADELKRQGYSEWKRGGVTFGSVDVGWWESEDDIYCALTKNGLHHYWSYSKRDNIIYAITYPT